MPRPTTKIDLKIVADAQFEKLWKLIDSMDIEKQTQHFHSKIEIEISGMC